MRSRPGPELAVRTHQAPREVVLTGARLVLPDEVVRGTLVLAAGIIRELQPGRSHLPGAIDLEDDFLLPGLIDLHTDSLEKHYQPRRGVEWDPVAAAISHDTQIAGSGITTVFDSLTLGAATGWEVRPEMVEPMVAGLRTALEHGMLRAEHWLHMRCEVTHPDIVAIFEAHADDPLVRFMSLMDHAPGDRQVSDVAAYRQRFMRLFEADQPTADRHIEELIRASRSFGRDHRRRLARAARERGMPFASHDDASPAHVAEAVALGAVLAEFPTTRAAARAARERGLKVLMGAPNLIRGQSHSGNLAATTLAAQGELDILSSDYIPASLLQAVFRLTDAPCGWSLPRAVATVAQAPAAAAGLADRGRLEPGLRADLVQVRLIEGHPVVRRVWSNGRRVA